MKRLLIFCTSTNWGGTEKDALLRAEQLQERGYDVRLITSSELMIKKAIEVNVDVKLIKRGGDINPFAIYRYFKEIREFQPDVLFLTLVKDYWLGSVAAKLAGVTSVFHFLGIERIPKTSLKYKFIYATMCTGIIVNSKQIKETFLKHSRFLKDEQIHVIVNGFNVFEMNKERPNQLKKQLGLKETDILIGASGRLTEQKGFDLTPDVFSKIKDIPNVYLAIAGEGEMRNELEAKLRSFQLDKRIFLLGFQESLTGFYQDIDLLVLFSRYEGMANVLNEAMSYGNPVISTRVSGAEELLLNGRLGDIVDIEDTDALANSIRLYIQEGKCTKNQIYIDHIKENYTLEKMIDKTERVFFS